MTCCTKTFYKTLKKAQLQHHKKKTYYSTNEKTQYQRKQCHFRKDYNISQKMVSQGANQQNITALKLQKTTFHKTINKNEKFTAFHRHTSQTTHQLLRKHRLENKLYHKT